MFQAHWEGGHRNVLDPFQKSEISVLKIIEPLKLGPRFKKMDGLSDSRASPDQGNLCGSPNMVLKMAPHFR